MKQLLFIFLLVAASFAVKAQSGTGTIDATNDVTINGGPIGGHIVSAAWTVQGTPPAAITISAANNLKTDVTVTKEGNYFLLLTVTDEIGTIGTGVYQVIAQAKRVIIIKVQVTPITIPLK
jgi:hypothetical protein